MREEAHVASFATRGRRALPVLAALDQQRVALVVRVVEERVVAQALARGVAGVDDDVLGRAQAPGEVDTLRARSRQRERRAGVGHRVQVEQEVRLVDDRAQRAGAGELARLARAVEHRRRTTARLKSSSRQRDANGSAGSNAR